MVALGASVLRLPPPARAEAPPFHMAFFRLPYMTPAAQRSAIDASDRERHAPFWPGWMTSRLGQWLARRAWLPFGRLWRFEVKLAELRELDAREMHAACTAMHALQRWAESDFAQPLSPALREQFMGAWCNWRTWHERKAETLGLEPLGSAEWNARQRRPMSEPLQ